MKRKSPISVFAERRSKHQQMLDDMHSALSSLGSKINSPMPYSGDKLLPKALQQSDDPEAALAKNHIEKLHKAFEGVK